MSTWPCSKFCNQVISILLWVVGVSIASSASLAAQESPQQFAFEGRLYQLDGVTPLTDTVNFRFQILNQNTTGNPINDCILYEESQNGISLANTSGVFSIAIGSAQSAAKRSGADPNLSLTEIFRNSGSVSVPVPVCPAGVYSPSAGSIRRLRVTITNVSTGVTETLSPDMVIGSVPQAVVAETLQGNGPSDFVKVDGSTAMSEALTFDNWATAGRPSSPSVGSTGFNTTTGFLETWNGSSWVDYSAGGGGGSLSGLTAGQATFATGATSVGGDADFYWDNSTKRLGVGTNSPSNRFHVPWKTGDLLSTSLFGSSNSANNQRAIDARSYSNYGVYGESQTAFGIFGYSAGTGGGVGGQAVTGAGLAGTSSSGTGVDGSSSSGTGVSGSSSSNISGLFRSSNSANTQPTLVARQNGTAAGNLFESQNNGGTTLSYINSSGFFYQPGAPTAATNQAATTSYVDSAVGGASGNAVNKDGTTQLTGNWNVGNRAISNVSTLSVGSNTTPTGGVAFFNGNVGIGTITPTSRLHVPWLSGDSAATAVFGSSNSSNNQNAIEGYSYNATGLTGQSNGGVGVTGYSTGGAIGVYGWSAGSGIGVLGSSTGGVSAQFQTTNTTGTNTNPTLVTKLNTSQTADLFQAQNAAGTSLVKITSTGNLGIGSSNPQVKLDVAGTIRSNETVLASGRTLDLSLGNSHVLQAPGGADITLQNIQNSGIYNIVIEDTTSRTYTFDTTSCATAYFSPANGATSNRSVFTVMKANGKCYISWATGFN